jgi:hypothetical protein
MKIMIALENANENYFIERLWYFINKDGIDKEDAKTILSKEIAEQISKEKKYKNFSQYFKPLEDALRVIDWPHWNNVFDPPKIFEKPVLNLKIPGIYEIVNIKNNKRYIGQSKSIKTRWNSHKTVLRTGYHHCKNLQKEWKEFGENAFKFNVIQEISNEEDLTFFERYWWENAIGEKYNDCYRIMNDKDYKLKKLELYVLKLENDLAKYKIERT